VARRKADEVGFRDVDDLVTDPSGGDVSGPANQTRRPQRAFHASEIGPVPVSGGPSPGQRVLGAVVAGEDDDRVVGDVEFVEQVEQGAEIGVHFQQAVGPVAGSAFAFEFVARHGRQMRSIE
jgi:hypothetical protein